MASTSRPVLKMLGLILSGSAMAGAPGPDPFHPREPVPRAVLAEQRGGLLNADGLKVTVGLESLVRINGNVESRDRIRVPDLSGDTAQRLFSGDRVQIVQNGPGNSLPADLADSISGMGTVIQNSLDNQTIQHLKALNIDISGLEGYREGQLGARVQTQILDSLR
mgnify:CR=1 FL=1